MCQNLTQNLRFLGWSRHLMTPYLNLYQIHTPPFFAHFNLILRNNYLRGFPFRPLHFIILQSIRSSPLTCHIMNSVFSVSISVIYKANYTHVLNLYEHLKLQIVGQFPSRLFLPISENSLPNKYDWFLGVYCTKYTLTIQPVEISIMVSPFSGLFLRDPTWGQDQLLRVLLGIIEHVWITKLVWCIVLTVRSHGLRKSCRKLPRKMLYISARNLLFPPLFCILYLFRQIHFSAFTPNLVDYQIASSFVFGYTFLIIGNS